jgi:hypothetical protein
MDWYNHQRIHGSRQNMPPVEYEAAFPMKNDLLAWSKRKQPGLYRNRNGSVYRASSVKEARLAVRAIPVP